MLTTQYVRNGMRVHIHQQRETRMHSVRLDRVPALIEHLWRTAENANADRAKWLEKAAAETDPEKRAGWEQLAEVEFDVASSAQADADDLLAQFRAAGGEMSLKH